MPTNFTVVPVDDVEGGSSGKATGAGGNKSVNLGKLFTEEQDEDNSQGSHSGTEMVHNKLLLWPDVNL